MTAIGQSAEKDLNRTASAAGQAAARAGTGLAKKAAGRGARSLFRLLASFLGPYLGVALAIIFVLLLIFFLSVGVFGAMTAGDARTGLFTGVNQSPADPAIQAAYQKLADKANVEDLHQVALDSSWMVVSGGQEPKYPKTPLYPVEDSSARLEKGVHSYYQQENYLPWGLIHSVRLWWAFLKNDNTLLDNLNNMKSGEDFDAVERNIPQAVRASTVAEDLHPYFYYIRRTFVTRYIPPPGSNAKPSTDVEQVYLLVEQYTVEGWVQYSYKRVHEDTTYPDGSEVIRDYDAQNGSHLVVPDRYQRIRNYLNSLYGMDPSDPQSDLMRLSVMEAGNGFVKHEQHVDWMLKNYTPEIFVSSAMVPPEYTGYFKEAEQKFGIPAWFLEAVCERESSFDPSCDNGEAGHKFCFGLMQVNVDNWNEYAPRLGFDPVADKDNPRAQILVGAFILKSYLGNVDWNSPNWKDQTLAGLAWYGGFRNSRGQVDQDALNRCRDGYANDIWRLADGFKNHSNYCWPVKGPHIVTSPFNVTDPAKRIHHGVDIAADMGQPIYSVSGGYVQEIGRGDPVYGNYVVVNDTVHTYKYAHFSSVSVQQNQAVEAGVTVLGLAGATGDATGPHLHLEIVDLATGSLINPLDVIGYDCSFE